MKSKVVAEYLSLSALHWATRLSAPLQANALFLQKVMATRRLSRVLAALSAVRKTSFSPISELWVFYCRHLRDTSVALLCWASSPFGHVVATVLVGFSFLHSFRRQVQSAGLLCLRQKCIFVLLQMTSNDVTQPVLVVWAL